METFEGDISHLDLMILLDEAYDTAMGIFDHRDSNADKTPLSSVKMLEAESVANNGKEYFQLTMFDKLNMGKRFNISIKEFRELPYPLTEQMFAIARVPSKRDQAALDALIDL